MNLAITGPTSGIGAETVKALASKFDSIFLIVRNKEKGTSLVNSLLPFFRREKFIIVPCDLADLSSVAEAANFISGKVESLHVLINNAGGIFPQGKLTVDNLEQTFQVNHLGHFLLTMKLMPLLENAGEARIINVSSEAHRAARPNLEDVHNIANFRSFPAYANAKLFNILFSSSLSDKFGNRGIRSYSLHPGVVKTNFGGDFSGFFKFLIRLAQPFMIDAVEGAKTSVYLSTTSSNLLKNGGYFKKSKSATPSKTASSKKLGERLWTLSHSLVKEYL
jgi:NAD(P)-dependent dehydrogenase (short-subunit alcohol dehydrogenase family)